MASAQQPGRDGASVCSRTRRTASPQSYVAAFIEGLRQLGWIEGQNLRAEVRWNAGDAGLATDSPAQLIGLMPDVILASTTVNLTVIQQATSTVPVVFVQVSDPVAQGFVASMTQPGGNLTGFSMYEFSIGGKWLDLLKEIAPGLARVAVMFNPDTSPQSEFFKRAIEGVRPARRRSPCRSSYPRNRGRLGEFREPAERRADAAGRQLHALASKADRRLGGPQSPTINQRRTWFRQGWRPDLLRPQN